MSSPSSEPLETTTELPSDVSIDSTSPQAICSTRSLGDSPSPNATSSPLDPATPHQSTSQSPLRKTKSLDVNEPPNRINGIASAAPRASGWSVGKLAGFFTKSTSSVPVVPTMALRPIGLPPKTEKETREYAKAVEQLRRNQKRKEKQVQADEERRRKLKAEKDSFMRKARETWLSEVIPDWEAQHASRSIRKMWAQGIPDCVRKDVWPLAIGNTLKITPELYEIFKVKAEDARNQRSSDWRSNSSCSSCSSTPPAAEPGTRHEVAIIDDNGAQYSLEDVEHCCSVGNDDFDDNVLSPRELRDDHSAAAADNTPGKQSSPSSEAEDNAVASPRPFSPVTGDNPSHADGASQLEDSQGIDSRAIESSATRGTAPGKATSSTSRLEASTSSQGHRPSPRVGDQVSKEHTASLIQLDLRRTFPQLQFYHEGPEHDNLHVVLDTYVQYRPDIGYVQGMTYLAALLLLYMDCYTAFVCLVNMFNNYHFMSFFQMDVREMNVHLLIFDMMLKDQLPHVHDRFLESGMRAEFFCIEWFVTLYSKSLPLDIAARIWDLFFMDSDYLYYVGLGIIKYFIRQFTDGTFEDMFEFITHLPKTIDDVGFFNAVLSLEVSKSKLKVIKSEARRLAPDKFG